ncbi:MAG: methylmalonyl Co-A mutase-associated GTPase MeaB [Deltaproteobacteria bacterium]|nr:methylmalonyl Co-A mutase-associated GTPase MeaB [Deltaproteobacteria bacterium]
MNLRSLSKTISQIENDRPKSLKILSELYAKKRGVPILGITGLPGAGKSTLVDHLIHHLRGQSKTVGVIAIDPSSPFSGGALLGDRIRMQRHATDEGVFIRSLGSRGAHGGLSQATHDAALCLDAYGFDQIIIESVGVGQTELDIMSLATTTVVVLVPEAGDAVQTLKAGLMEIADIFVVNKADRPGAEQMKIMLEAMVAMDSKMGTWLAPVLLTKADKGSGIAELWKAVLQHGEILKKDPAHAKHQEALRRAQFLEMCGEAVKQHLKEKLISDKKLKAILEKVAKEEVNPYEALKKILPSFVRRGRGR